MTKQVVAANPGYYLLIEWFSPEQNTQVDSIFAEPIVAWGCETRAPDSPSIDSWMWAEPIGLASTYEESVGILTPTGMILQIGNQSWVTFAAFCEAEYGRTLPLIGATAFNG